MFDPNSKRARRIQRSKELVVKGVISAPTSFMSASLYELYIVCNGCGSAQAKFDFVPDTIWGVYIGEACMVHDWEYDQGETIQDKKDADWNFLKNIIGLIYHKSKWYNPSALMCLRAMKYYLAVRKYGADAFWADKERTEG